MNKLFTKIAGVTLGFAMAIGVGAAVASNSEAVPVHATDDSISLTTVTCDANPTDDLMQWTRTQFTIKVEKGTGTKVTNYYPGTSGKSYTHTRFYTGNILTVTPASGYQIDSFSISCDGTGTTYTKFAQTSNCTVTCANATVSAVPTVKTNAFVMTGNGTGRYTAFNISYSTASSTPVIELDKESISVGVNEDATFIVSTAHLTSNFAITGGDDSYFTTSYTPAKSDGNHTVTLHGVAVTTNPITLTVSATGATSKTISVSVIQPVIYEKISSLSSLKAGKEFIIGSSTGDYVLGQYSSGNNCPALASTPNAGGNLVESNLPSGYALFTLGGVSGAWVLTDQDSKVYYGTSGQNYLKSADSNSDTWTISITSAGEATITSATSSRSIKKNSSSSLFSTYQSGQTPVSIYMVPSSDPEIEVVVTGSTSLGVGETATLTATKLNGATGTVNWATSNSSILSLGESTGDSVTVTAGTTLGTATITASLTGCEDVAIDFTVRKGSATVPYSVAEAIAVIDGSDVLAKTNVYTSGIISQVDSLNSDNSITYWFSDNGTTTNQMQAYKGFGLAGATFSSVDDLQVGDEVVVYGNLTKYSSTYEYAAGNNLYSHNRPVVELATITAIEGTLNANAGDDAWDLSGLTVKGTFTGSSTEQDVTSLVNLTTSDVPGTPSETTVRNVSVTATGKDNPLITFTQNVSGTVKVFSGLVASGNYRIHATREDVTYYLKENGTTGAPTAVTNFWEATVFTFDLVADNTYTISNGSNYLYTTDTNNGVRFGVPQSASNKNWTIAVGATTLEGDYNLIGCSGARFLTLYNGADWRAYNSATAGNRKENTDLQAFNATQFATEFLSTYTAGCNAKGGYDSSKMKWDVAISQFAYLETAEQIALRNAKANESGSLVEQAVARYDYIIVKYNTTSVTVFEDFIGRIDAQNLVLSASNNMFYDSEDNNTVAIVIIIAMVSISSFGCLLLLKKKRKHQ